MMFGKVQEGGKGVPPGIYKASFTSVEPTPAKVVNGKELPAAFKFSFTVLEGEYAKAIASRIPSGDVPKTTNGLGKFLAELTGITLAPGVDYDEAIKPCYDKPYTIVVKATENGGTRVDTVMSIKP